MIQSFGSRGTEDIFNGKGTKAARKACPQRLLRIAVRKLEQIDSVISADELLIPPGNRLETGKKMIRIPTHRTPVHPGEMLSEEFLIPMAVTQKKLAEAIHVPYQRINEIVNGRRGITPGTALRLAKFFGISPDFWMNLQLRWDMYHAEKTETDILKSIQPFVTDHRAHGMPIGV